MRAALALPSLLLLTAFVGGPVLAQTPVQPAAGQTEAAPAQPQERLSEDRNNQRIERITVEDGGSRVDELRVGGETKSIKVQPKTAGGGVPEYEVLPNNGTRDGGPSRSGAETITAPRVWTLRKF